MKSLRPSIIVTAGPLLLSIAFAAGSWVALRHSPESPGLAWLLAIGAAAGLAIFAPIAAILAVSERRSE